MDESEIAVYRQVFDALDADGDGLLSFDDLKQVLMDLGYRLTEEQVQGIIEDADGDGDGSICWDEFIEVVTGKPPFDREAAHMRRMFQGFDTDGTGFISVENIQEVLAECGVEADEERVAAFVAAMDTDEDGQISYEEFVAMVEASGITNVAKKLSDDQREEEAAAEGD